LLKHLSKLEKAGLVRSEKQGRVHTCELNAEPLREASDWLAHYQQFWDTKLDALEHWS
jgi:DNA-binding transcriptional ArsR family regulator